MKITWFAAILTSSFINLNDGHNGYERWFACFLAKKCQKSIICDLLKVSRKGQALKFFVAVTVCIVFVQRVREIRSSQKMWRLLSILFSQVSFF